MTILFKLNIKDLMTVLRVMKKSCGFNIMSDPDEKLPHEK